MWLQRIEFFGRCCDSLGAVLGSTVDTCSASVFGYLAVKCSVSGSCMRSTKIGFFGRSLFGCNAWLDSRYMICVSTWLLDDFPICSTLPWTRMLLRDFRSHPDWRSVLSRCFSLQSCLRCAHLGKLNIISDFACLAAVMMVRIFLGHPRQRQVPGGAGTLGVRLLGVPAHDAHLIVVIC